MGCARPHPPLNHLQFTLCASDHLLSPIIVIYETVLSALQDVSFQQPFLHLHPMVKVPSLCCSLGKPFESFVVFVADAFQGNPQAPP